MLTSAGCCTGRLDFVSERLSDGAPNQTPATHKQPPLSPAVPRPSVAGAVAGVPVFQPLPFAGPTGPSSSSANAPLPGSCHSCKIFQSTHPARLRQHSVLNQLAHEPIRHACQAASFSCPSLVAPSGWPPSGRRLHPRRPDLLLPSHLHCSITCDKMSDSNAPKPSSSVKLVLLGEAAVGKVQLLLVFHL